MRRHKGMVLVAGIASVVGLTLGVAAPAIAASANGTQICGGAVFPKLHIESSLSGSGSWQNRISGATAPITFPAGTNDRTTSFQQVNWAISNGASGTFYTAPYSACV